MILIFGGAYQGKLDYAKEHFGIKTVCDCREGREPDFALDAICGLECFVLECVKTGKEAADFFRQAKEQWQDKVFIVTDISQGIVPMDKDLRAMREMNGRLMLYLAAESEQVIRVFCGIGKKVK